MLRFITQQLQNHSLNEVQPVANFKAHPNHCNEETNGDCKDFDDVNYTCKTDVKLKECDIKCDFKKKLNTIIDKENIRDSCEQCQNLQQMYVRGSMESNGICFCKSQDFILSLQRMPHGEKRKFSNRHYNRLKHASLSGNFSCDSSSDDEVKDLCAKYKCISSSPPINELFNKSATQDNPGLFCVERIPSRPSLDLEKMQQKLLKRPRSRNDKNMTIQGVCFDKNDLIAYQPIQIMASGGFSVNNLVPVEEPLQSFHSGYVF